MKTRRGKEFWWPSFLRGGMKGKHCGILLTYADEDITRKVLGDLLKGPRTQPKKRKNSRALFARR